MAIAEGPRLLSRTLRDFRLFYYGSVIFATGCFRYITYDKVAGHHCCTRFLQLCSAVAAELCAKHNAPDRAVDCLGRKHETYLRGGVGIKFRDGEEKRFAGTAVGTLDGDAYLVARATHFNVFTFDNTCLSGTDGHERLQPDSVHPAH